MGVFGTVLGTFGVALNSASNNNVAVGSAAIQPGDLIYGVFAQQTNLTVTGVTDNLGNSYTATNIGTDAGTITGRAFYARANTSGTVTSITAAAISSTFNVAFVAAAFTGPFDLVPIDANIANTTADVTSPFACPTSGTLVQANELVIGWGCPSYGTAWAGTAGTTIATQLATQAVGQAVLGYQVVTSTVSITPQFSAGGNPTECVLGTNSFKLTRLMGQGIY